MMSWVIWVSNRILPEGRKFFLDSCVWKRCSPKKKMNKLSKRNDHVKQYPQAQGF